MADTLNRASLATETRSVKEHKDAPSLSFACPKPGNPAEMAILCEEGEKDVTTLAHQKWVVALNTAQRTAVGAATSDNAKLSVADQQAIAQKVANEYTYSERRTGGGRPKTVDVSKLDEGKRRKVLAARDALAEAGVQIVGLE